MGLMDKLSKMQDKANELTNSMQEKANELANSMQERNKKHLEALKSGKKGGLLGSISKDDDLTSSDDSPPVVLLDDGTCRPFTEDEIVSDTNLNKIKQMFEQAKVESKPRHIFETKPNPHFALGHYARFKAEAQGLEFCVGFIDSEESIYIQIDHEYFVLDEKNGATTVSMCVDSKHFDVERSGAMAAAFGGAVMGGADTADFRSKVNVNIGASQQTTGQNIAIGAAAGAAKGLLKANAAKKAAKAEQLVAMKEYIKVMLDQICDLMKSDLMDSTPPLLAELETVPKRHVL